MLKLSSAPLNHFSLMGCYEKSLCSYNDPHWNTHNMGIQSHEIASSLHTSYQWFRIKLPSENVRLHFLAWCHYKFHSELLSENVRLRFLAWYRILPSWNRCISPSVLSCIMTKNKIKTSFYISCMSDILIYHKNLWWNTG